MSRRHKEKPTISIQEIGQLAETVSIRGFEAAEKKLRKKPPIDLFSGTGGLQQALDRNDFGEEKCTNTRNEHIVKRLQRRCYGIGKQSIIRVLSHEMEASLTTALSKHLTIIDDPEQNLHPQTTRNIIQALFKRFKNCDVITILKQIYFDHYHMAIEKAEDLMVHAMLFMLSMCDMEQVSHKRKLAMYYNLLKTYIIGVKLKCKKTLENYVNRFFELKEKFSCFPRYFSSKKEEDEETKLYNRWMNIKKMYDDAIPKVAIQFALY